MKERLYNLIRSREAVLDMKAIWFGFTVSLGVWFMAAVLGILCIIFMGGGNYWFSAYIYIMGISGVLIGSIFSGIRAVSKGWLHGLWVGILLAMMGAIVNLELMPYIYTWAGIGRQLLVWSLWGFAGGHLGYYLKGRLSIRNEQRKRRSY